MPKKRYKKNKKYKRMVEIRTRRNNWTRAEFLGYVKGGKVKLRLISGEIINRKHKKMRWGVTKIVLKKYKAGVRK